MRRLLHFFSQKKFFGVPISLRILTVFSVLVLCAPPQFSPAPKSQAVALSEPGLPMPAVRFEKKETRAAPLLLPTAASLKIMSILQQEDPSNSKPSAAPPDGFTLTVTSAECTPWTVCEQKPTIEISAIGQLNKSKIAKIQVQVGEQGKIFNAEKIIINLPPTQGRGNWLTYWAIAEDGSQSPVSTIKYLNYKTNSEQEEYYFALMGAEWVDQMPSGSFLWEMFPPAAADFPPVLEQPLTAGYLYTTNHYSYLAGHLILSGKVKASNCPDGGIYKNGYASPCGEQQAAEKVLEWQNRYDQQIFDSSVRNKIPAKILKGMLAQETQFWPSKKNPYEIGLGSLTQNGIEMLLAWNKKYFQSLCVPAYGKACTGGYFFMNKDQQMMLRWGVLEKASTKEEIDVLGAVLFASAAQVNQMVVNTMFTSPGDVSSYEDMWKIVVANYHSGSGCISVAMIETAKSRGPLTWQSVSENLKGECNQAINYVSNVWRYAGGQP